MSIIQLRIELPTYARSFNVEIPETCTILEVKEEIYRTCPGRPRVEGQKLIWRGRFLADDEKVATIWKSPNEPRVAHLSVHPSAWVTGPPKVENTTTPRRNYALRPTPTISTPQSPQPITSPTTQSSLTAERLPFVFAKHVEAIAVLMEGRTNPAGVHAMPRQREETIKLLESNGWSWPAILDEPYPEVTPGGLRYEQVIIGDAPYLSLKAGAQPTPAQTHALRVLSYTFAILTKEMHQEPQSQPNYTVTQTIPDQQIVPNIPHLNDVLQQMGLPPVHNAPNVDAIRNREQPRAGNRLQDMPIRPLLAPLFMLILRTTLLLYFVAPARKPIFGLLILAWMLYEIWQPIRNNLLRQLQQNEQNGRQDGVRAPGVPEQPGAAPPMPGPNAPPIRRRGESRAMMEMLGNINVEREQRVMTEATQENSMEPSLGHKVLTFFGLLVTTLHPAIWNQRRAALRVREGTVRTEINMRDAPPRTDLADEETQRNEERAEEARRALRERHARRPRWVQQYMERVMAGEWVDDAD